jgi:hypothetical protein
MWRLGFEDSETKKKPIWKFFKNFFPCPQLFDMSSPGLDSDGSSLGGTLSYGYLESNKDTTTITVLCEYLEVLSATRLCRVIW